MEWRLDVHRREQPRHVGPTEAGSAAARRRCRSAERSDVAARRLRAFQHAVVLQRDADVLGSTPVPGFGADTPMAPNLEGVPQQRLSNPFPTGVNPVVPPVGKGDGRYTQMGAAAVWDNRDLVTGVNDRFNITLQRETIARFLVEATYFFNYFSGTTPAIGFDSARWISSAGRRSIIRTNGA